MWEFLKFLQTLYSWMVQVFYCLTGVLEALQTSSPSLAGILIANKFWCRNYSHFHACCGHSFKHYKHFFNIAGVYLITCMHLLAGIFVFKSVNLIDMESIFILIRLATSSVILLIFEDILILSGGNYAKACGYDYLVFVDWCMHILFPFSHHFWLCAHIKNECFPKVDFVFSLFPSVITHFIYQVGIILMLEDTPFK